MSEERKPRLFFDSATAGYTPTPKPPRGVELMAYQRRLALEQLREAERRKP